MCVLLKLSTGSFKSISRHQDIICCNISSSIYSYLIINYLVISDVIWAWAQNSGFTMFINFNHQNIFYVTIVTANKFLSSFLLYFFILNPLKYSSKKPSGDRSSKYYFNWIIWMQTFRWSCRSLKKKVQITESLNNLGFDNLRCRSG